MNQRMNRTACLLIAIVFGCAVYSSANAVDIITTIAGTGTAGYTGDGGAATAATLNSPTLTQKDSAGNIFFAEFRNHVIRRIDAVTGVITTFAGTGIAGFSGDGGPATKAQFNGPAFIALDAAGNMYVTDQYNNRVRKIAANGTISTFAGTGGGGSTGDGGPATSAATQNPGSIVIDPNDGAIVFAIFNASAIRRVDKTTNVISTIAGNGTNGFSGDGGLATAALINLPESICYDATGNLYFIDGSTNPRIRRIDKATKIITTFAGSGVSGYSGDGGPASAATFRFSDGSTQGGGQTFDTAGNLLICDTFNNCIRQIDTTGKISTIAGNGNLNFNGDFIDAATASINTPISILPEAGGNYLLAQFIGNRISRVTRNSTATPRSITLTPGTIGNNSAAGTSAGTLATTGTFPAGTTFTYTLIFGTGSTNNSSFKISGTSLVTSSALTTTAKSLLVRVRSTDNTGAFIEAPLTIAIAGPSFTSAPSASPTSGFTQQVITFTAAAGTAAITWTFDDGSPALTGASVTHAFNTTGTHVATATATDATGTSTASVSVQINTATPFTAGHGTVTFDFKKHNDSFSLTGNVAPPAGVDPSIFIGVTTVTVIIGKYQHDFTLNSHGQDKGTQNLFSIKGKISKKDLTGSAAVTITLKKQELFTELMSFGFVNADVKTPINVPVTVLVILNTGDAFTTTVTFSYTAKAGVSGKAKSK